MLRHGCEERLGGDHAVGNAELISPRAFQAVPARDVRPVEPAPIAPAAGVLVYRKSLGESVKTGAVVAEVVDPLGGPLDAARSEVRAGTDGLLFARMSERLVRPGQKFCKLAGREPLDYRQAGKLLED